MFTTGSKLFLGATVLSFAGTLVYGASHDGGPLGTLSLFTVTMVFAFLTGINFWVRDGNVSAMDTASIESSPAAHSGPTRSLWPMIAAAGVALVPVGLIVGKAIVWVAVILVLIATVEWMVQSFSEGASGDADYNRGIRRRILHPMELPILGAVGLGLIIFSFSRIMLRVPSSAGPIIFGGIGGGVLLFGSLIATKRTVARSLVVALCTIGAVGLVGAGVASAIAGGRHIAKHELPSFEEGTCGADTSGESDANSSRAIASKSNLAATITLEHGMLRAQVTGVASDVDVVTLPRSTDSFIRFRNLDDGKYRLVVNLGKEVVDPKAETKTFREVKECTQAVGEGGTQFIIVKAAAPSPTDPNAPPEEKFSFTVPGVDNAVLAIVVP
jgi:Cytochrome c oxidase subunit IV